MRFFESRVSRAAASVVFFCALGPSSSCMYLGEDEKLKEQNENTLLFALIAATYFSNPCNFAGVPSLSSAQASGTMAAAGSIRGKIITSASTGAVGALVIADSGGTGTTFYSTHSSVERDGTFFIAGIPAASSPVRIAVEPIHSDYYNRIDTHIDCFMTPRSFTAGWARGNGLTVTTPRASGIDYTITNGAVTDAGNIVIN